MSAVFCNAEGRFISGFVKPKLSCTRPDLVKAMRVRKVFSWIRERNQERMIIETDCLKVC